MEMDLLFDSVRSKQRNRIAGGYTRFVVVVDPFIQLIIVVVVVVVVIRNATHSYANKSNDGRSLVAQPRPVCWVVNTLPESMNQPRRVRN